ncbi:hypothetical protein X798_03573 [Onchocerca flexuosa]|uniref:Uncharacterized protein n=1 Tax=Onchocerca flexuosa TaxID=387005 RepID=A0A238BVX7_9BILA|nr:hypothetical protein X798_03573 [Onchocerca flexuosa]
MEKVHNQRDSPLRWRGANGCGKLACGQMIGFYGRSVVQIVRLEMLGSSIFFAVNIMSESVIETTKIYMGSGLCVRGS